MTINSTTLGSSSFDEPTTAALIRHLEPFVTPHKREVIDQVLACRTRRITVVVEDLFQSHNASAVIRTSECLGIQDVHVIEDRNAFETSGAVAVGSAKWVDIHRHRSSRDCLTSLRGRGYRIVALTLRGPSRPVSEISIQDKLALCFGSEEPGLSEQAHGLADVYATLPMYGFTQSYNVSVSAALALNDLLQRLRDSQIPWHLSADEMQELRLAWYAKTVPHARVHIDYVLKHRNRN
jgi:tRNA (guanosine-2'-O-)-methyltransferase